MGLLRDRKKLHDYIFEELAENPAWKVIVLKNRWVCPFCGEIGAEGLSMEEGDVEERIADHLRGCPDWDRGRGLPLDLESLQRRALLITFKDKIARILSKDPRWQVVDLEGCWICPYCARGTDIELAEARSDVARDRDHALTKIARHLLECEPCQQGEGEEKSARVLESRRRRINEKKQLAAIRERIRSEEVFRLRDVNDRWLCPFCADACSFEFDRKRPLSEGNVDGVRTHLEECGAYRELRGKPRTLEYLKERLIRLNREGMVRRVRSKVTRHEVWQVRDDDGIWYCPYCGEATGIRVADPRDPSDLQLHAIWDHLSACPSYTERARIRPVDELRATVEEVNRTRAIRRRAEEAVASDPAWNVSDPGGSWVCPFCLRALKAIAVTREEGLVGRGVELCVRHLEEECPAYDPEAEPADVATVRAAVDRDRLAESNAGHRVDGAWRQELGHEMDEIRSRMESWEATEKSLREARWRQLSMLPQLPEIPGYEFACIYKPCDQLSGDFYAFLRPGASEVGFALGDIAGHGVNAALLVGLAKKLFEIHGREASSPAETLVLANADIYPDLDSKTFLTAFYGLLDTERSLLRFSRAGHNPPILFNPDRTPSLQVLESRGMALGMDTGTMFAGCIEELEVELRPGDLILEYTDGVIEAMNQDREEFGQDRLLDIVREYGMWEGEYLLYKIEKALYEFREGAGQMDDITIVCLRVGEEAA